MHVGEGPRDGSLLASMDLSPSRLDSSSGGQEHGRAEVLLELWDQLLMSVSHDLQTRVWNVDQEHLFSGISNLELMGDNFLYK